MAKILGIALAVYLFLKFLLPLAIPFLLAFLLAKWLYPLIAKLHSKIHVKRGLLAGVILLLLLGLLGWTFWGLGRNLFGQLQLLISNAPSYWEAAGDFCHSCCLQIEQWTGYRAEQIEYQVLHVVPELLENAKGNILPAVARGSADWLKGLGGLVGIGIVTGIATLLVLAEYPNIRSGMQRHVLGRSLLQIMRKVYHAGGGYVKAQLLIMVLVTVICVIGLFCTGNSYALIAGTGIGFCDALPFLGTGTIFIPWAVIKLFQGEYLLAAAYAVIYTIATLTRELMEPRLVGDKLGMPPLVVIIAVYVGLKLYGLWGFALGPISYILIREIWRELRPGPGAPDEFETEPGRD
ncbi:MAG: AI-2E family transporter [Lachnospiraceae bacterium]|nr:AI-2E family transporter [Lachnospiraceae bacterium]